MSICHPLPHTTLDGLPSHPFLCFPFLFSITLAPPFKVVVASIAIYYKTREDFEKRRSLTFSSLALSPVLSPSSLTLGVSSGGDVSFLSYPLFFHFTLQKYFGDVRSESSL
jgi:hypothetical protein